MWRLVTECDDHEECDGCGYDDSIEKEEELLQVESLLRVAKKPLWRQEELELMETRKRESTMPMVKGQGVPYKSKVCAWHTRLLVVQGTIIENF